VTFLILHKIGKIEEAKKYVDIARKMVDILLEEQAQLGDNSLSVIMESTGNTLAKPGETRPSNNDLILNPIFSY